MAKKKSMKSMTVDAETEKAKFMKLLKEENPPIKGKHKYAQFIVLLEVKKVDSGLALLKGEFHRENKLDYRGTLMFPIGAPDPKNPTIFDTLNPGEFRHYGVAFDSREPKVAEKAIAFFKRSFDDARIQDFIPFAPGRAKSE